MNKGVRREWRSAKWVPISILFPCGSRVNRPGSMYPLQSRSIPEYQSLASSWKGVGSAAVAACLHIVLPQSLLSGFQLPRAATGLCDE